MTQLNEVEYIENRVDDQLEWYSRKSSQNQKNFKRLRIVEIIAAALIPFLSGYMEVFGSIKYVEGLLGILVAVVAGILNLNKFQENWVEYRLTAEALKREKFLYKTRSDPYTTPEPFTLFVQRIETILSEESSNWKSQMRTLNENNNQRSPQQ